MKEYCDPNVTNLLKSVRHASSHLSATDGDSRNSALQTMATALAENAHLIISENQRDLAEAQKRVASGEIKESVLQRLKLDESKISGIIRGIEQLTSQPDPIGKTSLARQLDDNLDLYRISCPIGVIAVIFEARPDAMPQIMSLCLKSANAVVLKGGSEAEHTNRAIFSILQNTVELLGLPKDSFGLLESRSEINQILKADKYIDLIIPRGSKQLVSFIQSNTRIPVLGHSEGICHVYLDKDCDPAKAIAIVVDSKTQYPSACNTAETLLIHRSLKRTLLPNICIALQKKGVELRLDTSCLSELRKIKNAEIDYSKLHSADENDWQSEYGDLTLAIRSVDSIDEAIDHINQYGSGHTETMISESMERFEKFFAQVNSAGVYLNASTRFADGFRYGFGAEVGISTSRIHPRGPVGVEGLLTYKYKIVGDGQIVADYVGPNARTFKHIDHY